MSSRFLEALTRIVCDIQGEHRMVPFGSLPTARDRNMRYAEHWYCSRCEAHELRWKITTGGPLTGEVLRVPRVAVVALFPEWLEGLYRARWGELPRQAVVIGGEFPADWRWND